MKKIRVNARAITVDIKNQASLESLLEKHGLSYRNLLKTRDLLLENEWLTEEEVEYLQLAPTQKTVSAKEFLASFRDRPDDFYLMEIFELTAKELHRIYERLMQIGVLSEYEYNCRDKKALESEVVIADVPEESTEVTLLKNVFKEGWGLDPDAHSSEISMEKLPPPSRANKPGRPSAYKRGDLDEESTLAVCPNCGSITHPSSPTACISCGIVYSKVSRASKRTRDPVWQFDYGIR